MFVKAYLYPLRIVTKFTSSVGFVGGMVYSINQVPDNNRPVGGIQVMGFTGLGMIVGLTYPLSIPLPPLPQLFQCYI